MRDTLIIRHHVERDFTLMPNGIVRDNRLSWKALGLVTYLLHLPPNWKLRLSHLAAQKKDGRESTRAGLAELERFGYLTITQERDASGHFGNTIWTVTDKPIQPETGFPNTASPQPATPKSVTPVAEKKTLLNTKKIKSKEIKKNNTTTTKETEEVPSISNDNTLSPSEKTISYPLVEGLVYPHLEEETIDGLKKILVNCPDSHQQAILDEIEGKRTSSKLKSVPGFAFILVKNVLNGKFNLNLGIDVKLARERRMETERVLANAAQFFFDDVEPISQTVYQKLPERVRKKYDEALEKQLKPNR